MDSQAVDNLLGASCRRFWPVGREPCSFLPREVGVSGPQWSAVGLPGLSRQLKSKAGPPFPGIIPGRPGVYLFRDGNGTIHYVGKAKCLRKRLAQYSVTHENGSEVGFQKHMRDIWDASEWVDWLPTPDELGALVLELDLVGRLKPRFNRALNPPPRRLLWLVHQQGSRRPLRFVGDPNQKGEVLFGPIRGGSWTTQVLEALLPTGERENWERIGLAVAFARGEGIALPRELEEGVTREPGMGENDENIASLIRRIEVLKTFDQRRLRQNLAQNLCGYFPISPLGPQAWNQPMIPGRKWFYAFWNGRLLGVVEVASACQLPQTRELLEEILPPVHGAFSVARGPEEPLLLQGWLDRSPGNAQSFVCTQSPQSTGSAGSA